MVAKVLQGGCFVRVLVSCLVVARVLLGGC